MNIIIFDITNKFIKEAKRLEKYGITVIESSVEDLIKKHHIDAVVSPANSFGFMNGGIDKVYMKLFNGIESIVQNRIMQIGIHKNNYRSKYLPVGSAITVQTKNNLCPFLISAPTMTMPGNIKGTNNILLCFVMFYRHIIFSLQKPYYDNSLSWIRNWSRRIKFKRIY